MEQEQNKISSGSHSINIGTGNSVTNSSLHLGDVHNYGNQKTEPIATIDRVRCKPVAVFGNPLKAAWLAVSGILGIIGSLASIVSLWQNLSFWFVLLMSFASFCFVVGISLMRHRFVRIPLLPYNFEADQAGKVFLTKIEGTCPRCDGILKLREIGPKDAKKTFVRCTRNPDHLWEFDFTVLDEPQS